MNLCANVMRDKPYDALTIRRGQTLTRVGQALGEAIDPHRALAMGLAVLAGFIDAIGFLKSGGLFVSFMSGNSTRLAVSLATGSRSAILAVTLIAAFVGGVIAGSLLSAASAGHRKRAALAAVAVLLAGAAILARANFEVGAVHCMALAMGCANTVFQREGEVTIGVTYMTGTLVRMGQRIAIAALGGSSLGWLPYLLLWLSLIGGAIAGAIGYHHFGLDCLWPTAFFALVLAIFAPDAPL